MSGAFPVAETPGEERPEACESIVAANVKRLREAADLTQAELAERVTKAGYNLGEMAIWSIENGKRRIRVGDVFALAAVLGSTPQQLLDPEAPSAGVARLYTVVLDGGVKEEVTADRADADEDGWFNFYLDSERVFAAVASRILGIRFDREAS
jgi:transcriptional regulator with XRE-family HTH domain